MNAMSTFIVSIVIIAGVFFLVAFFRIVNKKKQTQNRKRLVKLFEASGVKHHLQFSSQEILYNSIMGFDGPNRKFLFIDHDENEIIIELDEVKNIAVEKRVQPFIEINQKVRRSENIVSSVDLVFHFKMKKAPVSIKFFDRLYHAPILENKLTAKAKDWEIILTKMLDSGKPA